MMQRRSHSSFAIVAVAVLSMSLAPQGVEAQFYGSGARGPESPGHGQALVLYQQMVEAFQNGDWPMVINIGRQAERLDNRNKDIFNVEALAYAQVGDQPTAIAKFRGALGIDYNFVTCRNNYGVLLDKMGKEREAIGQFEECVKIDHSYAEPYYHLGCIYERQGDLDKAIKYYDAAVQRKPQYADAERDLGLALYKRAIKGDGGEIGLAVEKLKIAEQYAPQNPLVHYHLGRVLCAESKLDNAEDELRNALICDPKLAAGHYELAKLRYYRGDPYRACDEAILCLQIPPSYGNAKDYPKVDLLEVQELEAKCFEIIDDLPHADEAWRKVANMQTNNLDTLKHLSNLEKIMHAQNKRRSKAQVNPAEVQAMVDKGISQVNGGDVDGGKASFDRALELDPQSFGGLVNAAQIAEAHGDLNGAMAKFQAASQVKPKYDGLFYEMAYLLEKMGLASDAGAMYQRFHDLAGRYPYDPKHIVSIQQDLVRQRIKQGF
jgi:tetratricopeptide (TPR) repeat protein